MAMHVRSAMDRQAYQPMSEINVTPLVDVMLVLLIIFMITSPMLVAGIEVDLPESKAAAISAQETPLTVTVDAEGSVYIQETEVEPQELIKKLEAMLKNRRTPRIYVRGDKAIDYGRVMEVVGMINAAGYDEVALITEISNGS